jgi:protein disulfide-isomerase-like protein
MAALRYCRLAGTLSLALMASPVFGETVETLTSANFAKRIQADIILVKFYAPWCGHCKAMAPAYEEAAQILAKNSPVVPLAKVDATVEPQITQGQNVKGYPTLKIFKRGVASDYGGPRDAAGIIKYMKEQVGSAASVTMDTASSGATGSASETVTLIARMCRDQTCNDAQFPMIDYDENEKKCLCAAHPCWNDDGKAHSCDLEGEFPHLSFSYTKEGQLECGCRKEPHYMSKYIAQVKCPGEHCDNPEFPIVDYQPEAEENYGTIKSKCVCRAHPCHDLDGVKHECSGNEFPILNYREEVSADGGIKKICECKAPVGKKKDEL